MARGGRCGRDLLEGPGPLLGHAEDDGEGQVAAEDVLRLLPADLVGLGRHEVLAGTRGTGPGRRCRRRCAPPSAGRGATRSRRPARPRLRARWPGGTGRPLPGIIALSGPPSQKRPKIPPNTMTLPRPVQIAALALRASARNQPRWTTSSYMSLLDALQGRGLKWFFSSDSARGHRWRRSRRAALLVGVQRGCGSGGEVVRVRRQSVRPNTPFSVSSMRQVTADGQVDHGRGHVDGVGRLVDDGADHPGLHARRRGELHRDRGSLATHDRAPAAPWPGVRPGVSPAYCSSRPPRVDEKPISPAASSGRVTPVPMLSSPGLGRWPG